MSMDLKSAIKALQGFSALSDSVLDQLVPMLSTRIVRAGETIFCQGEPSPFCFGIQAGEVVIQRVAKDNRFPPKILGVLGTGSLFGESSILEDSPRAAMATVSKDGKLIVIRGQQLRAWMRDNPQDGQPLLLALLEASMGRLHRTSHELAVIYGLGRLLGSDKPFTDQLNATLDFLKGSLEGLDDLIFYRRNAYWEEFTPLMSLPEVPELAPIPLQNDILQHVSAAGVAQAYDPPQLRTLFQALKLPWENRAAVCIIPLFDWDKAKDPLQGILLLGSATHSNAFSAEKQLLLTSISHPLAEALSRYARQEESQAQTRLQQSKKSFPE